MEILYFQVYTAILFQDFMTEMLDYARTQGPKGVILSDMTVVQVSGTKMKGTQKN